MRRAILLLLLCLPLVLAIEDTEYESYSVNETANLKIRVANATDIITDANCTIDIYDTANTLVTDNGKLSYGGRRYNYSFVFNETGEWFIEYSCNNSEQTETVIYGKEISIQQFDIPTLPQKVWNYEIRNLTYYPPVDVDTITAGVWNYSDKTLSNVTNIVEGVWNRSNRTLTGQDSLWVGGTEYSPDETIGKIVVRIVQDDKTPVLGAICNLTVVYPNNTVYLSLIMTEAIIQNGLYFRDFNLSDIPGVYPYIIDCAGGGKNYYLLNSYHVFGANRTVQAQEVWEYPDRQLTYINVSSIVNRTAIAEEVWNWQGSIAANILDNFVTQIWNYTARYINGEII